MMQECDSISLPLRRRSLRQTDRPEPSGHWAGRLLCSPVHFTRHLHARCIHSVRRDAMMHILRYTANWVHSHKATMAGLDVRM